MSVTERYFKACSWCQSDKVNVNYFLIFSLGTELQNGLEYVITVRATNPVGLRQQATSDGFTVDATAPVSGRVVIVSPSPSNFDIQQITARYGAVKKAHNFTVKTVLTTENVL
jgi:hypothetical protein